MKFWQLVKFINGQEVIEAIPPPDTEGSTAQESLGEINKIMRQPPKKEAE